MTVQKNRILIGVPEITHRQIAMYEVEGLRKLNFYVITSLYGGIRGYNYKLLRLFIIIQNAYLIIKIIRKEKIDLVYLNTTFDVYALFRDFLTLFLLHSYKPKILLKSHGSDAVFLQTNNLIYRFMIKRISRWSDGFGILSSEERQNFINSGFKPDKVFILKNIVVPGIYLKNEKFREIYNIPVGIPILFFVGRFIPSKGLINIIKAITILNSSGIEVRLLCIGDGPENEYIRNEVKNLDLVETIIFTGFIDEEETNTFYANTDMLIFPTQNEGFSMAIFKSVTAGLPIITTRIRAAADYLREPDNCLWVEPNNPEMIAKKIIYLLENPGVCKHMSENNKQLSKSFTQEIVCKELESIYKQLLNK